VKRAWEAAVRVLVATAFDPQSCVDTLKLAEGSEFVVAALGYHPWFPAGSEQDLGTLLDHPKVVALGEIGLDSKGPRTLKEQVSVLDWQLDLALRLDLPVVLHCRGAAGELLRTLKRHQGTRGVIHGFPYEASAAAPFLALGLHFSLSGVLTLPGDNKVKRLAAALPLDRLLLETDSPALPIAGIPKHGTEPAHLPLVFEALCALRPEAPARLAAQLLNNAGVALGPRLGAFLEAASRVP
jgi:TatD DNase family protein